MRILWTETAAFFYLCSLAKATKKRFGNALQTHMRHTERWVINLLALKCCVLRKQRLLKSRKPKWRWKCRVTSMTCQTMFTRPIIQNIVMKIQYHTVSEMTMKICERKEKKFGNIESKSSIQYVLCMNWRKNETVHLCFYP